MSKHYDNWTLRTRWAMRRNAVLGSRRFLDLVQRWPILRWVARRKAAAQFDLVAGFVYSQILSALVKSGLIEHLVGEPRRFSDIAAFLSLSDDAADRLLRAGAALDLLEQSQPGWWTLGEAGAPLAANSGAMAMVRHHDLLYRDLADPLALLRQDRRDETALSAFWTYASRSGPAGRGAASDYSELMAATQPMVSDLIVNGFDFSRVRRVLDVGGGSAAFVSALLRAVPRLECGIFDLPDVTALAAERLANSPYRARVALHPGSFRADPVPQGYDLITLVRILHDHDDDVVTALLASAHAALPAGGRLLIAEPMAQTPSAPRMGDAYFGFYLWAMGSGRPRSAEELQSMLRVAGFHSVHLIPTALPLVANMLVAQR
jgi:demethylspheroidene O-methyltransferase